MRDTNRYDRSAPSQGGDADLSVIGAALADRGRARMMLALADGRALPASVLASEAGVRASTASAHLRRLLDADLLEVFTQGRFRYYRLAGDDVGELVETMIRLAPSQPIRSLREGNRAHALRLARCCYDHLAGRLGVAITDALIDRGHLVGGDGTPTRSREGDRLAGGVRDDRGYRLTDPGREALQQLDVVLPESAHVHCCIDWTEQRHHIRGVLGRGLLDAFIGHGWLRRTDSDRTLRITDEGRSALEHHLDLPWPPPIGPARTSCPRSTATAGSTTPDR